MPDGRMEVPTLQQLARTVRQDVLEISYRSRSGHIGSSFSAVDLLVGLYFRFLRLGADMTAGSGKVVPEHPERDRFIMGKGHACAAYYSVLHRRGFFDREYLCSYGKDGGELAHHPVRDLQRGIEASTGSLGHGLSLGTGLAYAAQLTHKTTRTAVMLSDGEQDEGTTWEAALFAGHHQLEGLLAVVDCNRMQALGFTKDILGFADLAGAWRSFGWGVRRINGHDMSAVVGALDAMPFEPGKPSVLLADTIKGKGVSFMENQLLWHYRCPDAQEYERALQELAANA